LVEGGRRAACVISHTGMVQEFPRVAKSSDVPAHSDMRRTAKRKQIWMKDKRGRTETEEENNRRKN
jgi:hypothetical protein